MFKDKLNTYVESKLPDELSGNSFIAVLDTETTGFSKIDHDLISLSIEIRNQDWEIQDEKTVYASPQAKKRWTEGAEKIHGFSFGEACSFPHAKSTAIELLHFLKPFKHDQDRPILFVSHDLNGFDFGFMEWLYRWQSLEYSFWKVFNYKYRLSTIDMARDAGYSGNKLDAWAERLKFDLNHHEAESDRIACSKIFKHLIEANNEMGVNQ